MTRQFLTHASTVKYRRNILSWFQLPTALISGFFLFVLSGADASAQEPLQNLFSGFSKGPYPIITLSVPGIIILYLRSKFTAGKRAPSNTLLPYLAVSSIYYALVSVFLIATSLPWTWESGYQNPLQWILVVFFGPVIFGVLLGLDTQRDYTRHLLRKIGLYTVHTVPTAWDWKFNRIQKSEWVVVTLENGTRIVGFFGRKSFASSDPTERDIYIEKTCRVDDEGNYWQPANEEGILISRKEIKAIQFLPSIKEN